MPANQPPSDPANTSATPPSQRAKQSVWDIATRLVHWSLVIGIALSWWSVENKAMDIHYWSGLTLLGLLVFRIYWGFAGPETARFSHFVKGPRAIIAYLGKLGQRDYRASFGHNPLGALSVVALLAAIGVQVGLGLFASDTDGLSTGPLNRHVDYSTAETITEFHEAFFNWLLILVGLHLAAITFYVVVKRINLVGPMITGRRTIERLEGPAAGIKPVPLWRFLLGVALAVGVVWFVAR